MEQSTFWSEEHLVRISQSQDSELEWLEIAATSRWNFLDWLNACGHAGWYGRTSPEFLAAFPTELPIYVDRETTFTKESPPATEKWSRTDTTQTKTMLSPLS